MIERSSMVARAPNSFASFSALSRFLDDTAAMLTPGILAYARAWVVPIKPQPRIPIFMLAWVLRHTEGSELVVGGLHRPIDFGERWPRFALELDLDTHRSAEATLRHEVENALEVDMALADRREVPNTSMTSLVLQVAVDERRQCRRQSIDGLHSTVKLNISSIVVDENVLPS